MLEKTATLKSTKTATSKIRFHRIQSVAFRHDIISTLFRNVPLVLKNDKGDEGRSFIGKSSRVEHPN